MKQRQAAEPINLSVRMIKAVYMTAAMDKYSQ